MGLDERQKIVAASALWADGYNHEQIAAALDVDFDTAVELTFRGADQQSAGTMGHMRNNPQFPEGRPK